MTAPHLLPPPEAIVAVQRLLEKFDNAGVIVGGVAVGMHSPPRATADVDAVTTVELDRIKEFIAAAKIEGITIRQDDAENFARKNLVLLLVHKPTQVMIDISFGVLPFEKEMVARSVEKQIGEINIRVPTPEDLIVMKTVAHRSKDWRDIAVIIESNPNLDKKRIASWVKQFAEVLEMPELWDDLSKMLEPKKTTRTKSRKRR
jgi:hypothetical protein